MDLQTLRFFTAAADTGSFSAAAEKMNYAQSNLSSRIKQLEDELGEPLFYRNRKGVSLTSKGKVFYDYASKVLQLTDEAVTVIQDMEEPRGNLLIGSLEATALNDLPKLLSVYHKKCPAVRLSLQTDMNDVFLERVLNRSLDGAFVSIPTSHPGVKEIPFRQEHLVLVGSTGEPAKTAEEILEKEPLVTFPAGSIFRHRLEMVLSSHSFSYSDRLAVLNSLGAMIAGICAGIGYGYLPQSITMPYVQKGLIRIYSFEDSFSEFEVGFIYRKDHIMDAAFRAFIEMI